MLTSTQSFQCNLNYIDNKLTFPFAPTPFGLNRGAEKSSTSGSDPKGGPFSPLLRGANPKPGPWTPPLECAELGPENVFDS